MAAWVKGDAVEMQAALDAAASLLVSAKTPIIVGLSAELSAVRAAFRLADRIGASLDPAAGKGLYADLGTIAAAGTLTTTAAEALGRADTVLMIGGRPSQTAFATAIADTKPSRGRAAGQDRTMLALGAPGDGHRCHVAWNIGQTSLDVAIGHLRSVVRGNLAGDGALGTISQRLQSAKFGVVMYDAAEIGEAGAEMLFGLLVDLADRTRAFALPMADPFQGRAVTQLSAWTTGQAPRVGFGRRVPEHDPWRFDSARQIAAGEVDAALWLASLPSPRPDWLGSLPSVAVVGEGSVDARCGTAEIVIAVGVPGVSTGGALWNDRRGVIGYVAASDRVIIETAETVLASIASTIERKGASC